MLKVKPRWTRGVDKEDHNEIKAEFLEAENFRKRLALLLREDVDTSLREMRGFVKKEGISLTDAYTAELTKQQTLLDILNLIE